MRVRPSARTARPRTAANRIATAAPSEPRPKNRRSHFPFRPPLSSRGPMPRTLVFGSVGDHTDAVPAWFGDYKDRDYAVAIVYYGNCPESPWGRLLHESADYFASHKGGKFQNLLWWVREHPGALKQFDYVLVPDDDIRLTSSMIGRMVRTAKQYDLPVSSPCHRWDGRISYWKHMMARGSGARLAEPASGIELCNFVEMTCVLFDVEALRSFLDLFSCYSDALTGWGADWLIASACFTERHPFGVMHNIGIANSKARPGLPAGLREIDQLQPSDERRVAWQTIVEQSGLPLTDETQLRAWLPQPRMRCISLDRAVERRATFTREWIDRLGFPVQFFSAIDRRHIEDGRVLLPYVENAARCRISRSMTPGEIACAASHALLMHEEMEFCGPEGVFIMEDDCYPISYGDAGTIADRIREAVTALPGVEVVACHEPYTQYSVRESAGRAARVWTPPWGSCLTWYGPQGLRRAIALLSQLDCPTDWIWRDFSQSGQFAVLTPPVALHDVLDTTYIGNEYRGIHRRYVP